MGEGEEVKGGGMGGWPEMVAKVVGVRGVRVSLRALEKGWFSCRRALVACGWYWVLE